MRKFLSFILPVFIFISDCGAPKKPTLTPEQRERNVASFEYVWETIRDKHWDSGLGGLDWDSIGVEFRQRVAEAPSKAEARQVLEEMISRLGQSHFNIVPAEVYKQMQRPAGERDFGGTTGIDVRLIDGRALVTRVDEGSPGDSSGVRMGWEIVRIDDDEIAGLVKPVAEEYEGRSWQDYIVNTVVRSRLSGSVGDSVAATFVNAAGDTVGHVIPLVEQKGEVFQVGYFPPFYVWFEAEPLDGNIGYIAFNGFLDPGRIMPAFNQAMESFLDAPGIVIDLRGNPGGIIAMAMGMAGWFIEEKEQKLGTITMRNNTIKAVVRPRPKVYRGPVAILVDGLSGSNSEIMAGGMKDLGRARIFGSRTAGAVLPSAFEVLPNGDGFQYAFANYESEGGEVLEGVGVFPDEEVWHTREALQAGRDRVLEVAVEWMRSQ